MIAVQSFPTPYGTLRLGAWQGHLCLCDWQYRTMRAAIDRRIQKALQAEWVEKDDPVLEETRRQLEEYFQKKRQVFDLPLLFTGTDFQKRVWEALLRIPYGSTVSYHDLAIQMANAEAVRAVAAANGANAISILVPCHRVVGSQGELTGYAGGLSAKKSLLQLEHAQTKVHAPGALSLFDLQALQADD